MEKVSDIFTAEELAFIVQYSGVNLSDKRDYSDDDLLLLHEAITESAPYDELFERVIDKFYDHFGI